MSQSHHGGITTSCIRGITNGIHAEAARLATLAGIALIALAAAGGGEARPWRTAAAVLVVLLCTALAAHFGSRRSWARVLGEHNARIDAPVEENRRLREETQTLASELKAAREQERDARSSLRQSEERFLVAVRGANDGLWEWDLSTDTLRLSPRWKAMLGYTAEDFPDRPDALRDQLHPEDLGMVQKLLRDHIEGLPTTFEYQARFRHRDGHTAGSSRAGRHCARPMAKPTAWSASIPTSPRIKRVEAIVESSPPARRYSATSFSAASFAISPERWRWLRLGDRMRRSTRHPGPHARFLAGSRIPATTRNTNSPAPLREGHTRRFNLLRADAGRRCLSQGGGIRELCRRTDFGSDQRVIGHLALLDTRMMNEEILVEPPFRIFCARAGAEIERRQALERLRDLAA